MLFEHFVRSVWEHPRHVTVNPDALERFARSLRSEQLEIPNWRLPCLPEKDDEHFVQFLGVTTAINFCFRDPWTKKRYTFVDKSGTEWQGAMAMAMAMKEAWHNGVPVLDASYLRHISEKDLCGIFETTTPIPLREERVRILREVGLVLDKEKTIFWEFLTRSNFSMHGTIRGLLKMKRAFGLDPFLKKPQLFIMMYQGRALDSQGKFPPIRDIEDIGVACDYVLPKILRHRGVLVYDTALARKVDAWEIVEAGSREEVEIRAQTWRAMMMLKDRLAELRGEPVSMLALDYLLWRRGRAIDAPHHLTPTTAY